MSEFSLILNIVSTVVTALFELTLDIGCTAMFGEINVSAEPMMMMMMMMMMTMMMIMMMMMIVMMLMMIYCIWSMC